MMNSHESFHTLWSRMACCMTCIHESLSSRDSNPRKVSGIEGLWSLISRVLGRRIVSRGAGSTFMFCSGKGKKNQSGLELRFLYSAVSAAARTKSFM